MARRRKLKQRIKTGIVNGIVEKYMNGEFWKDAEASPPDQWADASGMLECLVCDENGKAGYGFYSARDQRWYTNMPEKVKWWMLAPGVKGKARKDEGDGKE